MTKCRQSRAGADVSFTARGVGRRSAKSLRRLLSSLVKVSPPVLSVRVTVVPHVWIEPVNFPELREWKAKMRGGACLGLSVFVTGRTGTLAFVYVAAGAGLGNARHALAHEWAHVEQVGSFRGLSERGVNVRARGLIKLCEKGERI